MQSILDIIDGTLGSNRWQQSIPYLAAQLACQYGLGLLPEIEPQLWDHISNLQNEHFKESRKRVFEMLIPLLASLICHYFSLSSTQLFEIGTSPKPALGQSLKTRHSLSEIAMHLAHMSIIHWQAWADIVYLIESTSSDGTALPLGSTVPDVPGMGLQRQVPNCADDSGATDRYAKIAAEV